MMLSGVSSGRVANSLVALSLRPQHAPIIRRSGATRRCRSCRFQSTASSNTTPVESITAKENQNVLRELQTLQNLLLQSRSQNNQLESLTRDLAARTSQMESRLDEINTHVSNISSLEKMVSNVRDVLHNNPALKGVVGNLETIVQRSRPYIQNYRYFMLVLGASVAILWKYRANLVYERTSEEVADLARRTLEQESLRLSIQDTLQTVANSPGTLTTLNDLVQKLITHERTQHDLVNLLVFAVNTPEVQAALLDLLQVIFQDPNLQQLTGEFLLKGLDVTAVKEMLDAQTAELVRDTILDDSVQQATAVGLKRSLWYSITPPFLWRFMEHKKHK